MNQLLQKFLIKDRIQHLTDEEVNQLRQASRQGDAFAQYGYGRWLYYLNPHQGAMKDAEELFFKTKDVLPDSMAAYALMIRYGEPVSTRPSEMDIEEYQKLLLPLFRNKKVPLSGAAGSRKEEGRNKEE